MILPVMLHGWIGDMDAKTHDDWYICPRSSFDCFSKVSMKFFHHVRDTQDRDIDVAILKCIEGLHVQKMVFRAYLIYFPSRNS